MKKQNKKKIFYWMLRILTKGSCLCCYKYWPRNLNVYPNTYSHERIFLFTGNSTIQFHHNKTNKDRYFDAAVSI